MAERTKPFFPLDLDSKEIDDGWVLPYEPTFASGSGPMVSAAPATVASASAASPQVDVNSATLEQLCEVPGIGPLRARRILSWRDKNGAFASVSDLSAVRGLGKKSLEQLRPHLTV